MFGGTSATLNVKNLPDGPLPQAPEARPGSRVDAINRLSHATASIYDLPPVTVEGEDFHPRAGARADCEDTR